MDKIKELLARLEGINADITELRAKCETADDQAKVELTAAIKAKTAQFDEYKGKLEEAEADIERQQAITRAKSLSQPVSTPPIASGGNVPLIETPKNPDSDVRAKTGFVIDWMAGRKLEDQAYAAIRAKDQRIQSQADDAVMLPGHWVNSMVRAKAVLSTDATGYDTDSGAANLFYREFVPTVLQVPVHIPDITSKVTIFPAANGKAIFPQLNQAQAGDFGGVAFTWPNAEGQAAGATAPYFKAFSIDTYECNALTTISLAMLRRGAVDVEMYMQSLLRQAYQFQLGYQVWTGTGTGQPEGIKTCSTTTSVNRQTAGAITWTDLVNLKYALGKGIRDNGQFLLSDAAEKALAVELDGTQRPLFAENTATGLRDRLSGRPYTVQTFTTIAAGTEADVVYGDLSAYVLAVETDMALAKSEHRYFDQGLMAYRVLSYVGGKLWNPTSVAVLTDPA